jgi:hypothetical protein
MYGRNSCIPGPEFQSSFNADSAPTGKMYQHYLCADYATGHAPYKVWADTYYSLRTSLQVQIAVEGHTKRLSQLGEHRKGLFPLQRAPEWFWGSSRGWTPTKADHEEASQIRVGSISTRAAMKLTMNSGGGSSSLRSMRCEVAFPD